MALLEADAALPVVRVHQSRSRPLVMKLIQPDPVAGVRQDVRSELVAAMGEENQTLNLFRAAASRSIDGGLQGAGKTTSVGVG